MVRATSTASYREEKKSGRTVTQSMKIMAVMGDEPMSLTEIQHAYENFFEKRIDKGTVSARINKLKELKIVKEAAPRKCKITGKTINPVYVA